MNYKRTLLLFLLIILFGGTAFASTIPDGVKLSIRLYNKRIYTPDSPIILHAGIINSSSNPYVFYVADKKIFSLQLSVADLHNEEIEPTREYISRRQSNQQVLYREIRLLPGEEYAFRIELSSFVNIRKPGIYFISAAMNPDLQGTSQITSNEISVHVRPGDGKSDEEALQEEELRTARSEILRKQNLSPDNVVRYMIEARQKGQWEKFFLYLDVKSLMLEHRLKREQYYRSSAEEQEQMIEDYKELLRSNMVNNEILLKPSSYEITRYQVNLRDAEEAEVTAMARYDYRDFTEIKRFVYYLHRTGGFWEIYRYEVTNEGTE